MKMINELIKSELKKHDDVMKLIWEMGVVSNYREINNVKIVNINSLSIIENINQREGENMTNKCILIKGVNVLLLIQCKMILKEIKIIFDKVVDIEFPNRQRNEKKTGQMIPCNKTKRTRVSTVVGTQLAIVNDKNENREIKRKIVQYNENLMRIPNPINDYNDNKEKMIMGIGIYSQYEFDINNNMFNKQVNIFKYFNSTRETRFNTNNSFSSIKRINDIDHESDKRSVNKKQKTSTDTNVKTTKINVRNRDLSRNFQFELKLVKTYNNYLTSLIKNNGNNNNTIKLVTRMAKSSKKRHDKHLKKKRAEIVKRNSVKQDNLKKQILEFVKDSKVCLFADLCPKQLTSRQTAATSLLTVLTLSTEGLVQLTPDSDKIAIHFVFNL